MRVTIGQNRWIQTQHERPEHYICAYISLHGTISQQVHKTRSRGNRCRVGTNHTHHAMSLTAKTLTTLNGVKTLSSKAFGAI